MSDAVHYHPQDVAAPTDRDYFLVDGCPRCREYVDDLGLHFDPDRFRAFWAHMIEVEWLNRDIYKSTNDKDLGTRLYLVSLSFERAFGIHPSAFAPTLLVQLREGMFGPEITDPRD